MDWWNEVTTAPQPQPTANAVPNVDWWKETTQPDLLEKAQRGEVPSIGQGKAEFMANPPASLSPEDNSSDMAGMGTQAVASLPTDIKERAAYFAKQRFPNDTNGISKYGVQDGRLFYEGDDGKYHFEEPAVKLGQLSKLVASSVGSALPMAGSVIGGVGSIELGGVPGAAAGAAGGDALRQSLAQTLAGQEGYKPLETAEEAALGIGGQMAGLGVGKTLSWNAARDLSTIQTPEAKAAIKDLEAKAAKFANYPLTAAEKTNLQSLINKENTLGSLTDEMRKFYQERTMNKAPAAFNEALGKISNVQSQEVGAQNLQAGAKDVINSEEQVLREKAKPLYNKAFYTETPEGELAPKTIQTEDVSGGYGINASPIAKLQRNKTYNQFAKEASSDPILQGTPQDSFVHLDKTRSLLLQDMRSLEAQGKKNSTPWRRLNSTQKQIDATIQQYLDTEGKAALEQARGMYTEGMPSITGLKIGEVGVAANKKPTQLLTVPTTIFNSGPEAIARNRQAFVGAGQEQAWNDGLAAHLQGAFTKAISGKNLTPEASFRDAVFANGGRDKMKAAMTRDQFINFNDFMDVMEAAGRFPKGGSRAAFAGEGIAGMKRDAGGVPSKILRVGNPSNLVNTSRIADAYDNFMLGKYSKELAEITTSPDNMSQLKELRGLSPRSKKAVNITSQLLARYGIGDVAKPSDVPLGGFSDMNANQQ
jgi:hypothetical protein